jgi:hypothetical protein
MLPSPAELRERSRFYREAARDATETHTKDRRINCAFVLAQVAQMIERDKQGADANAVRLARMLADVLAETRKAPSDLPHADTIATKERAISDLRERIRAWRMRAEKLRATADRFPVPSAQGSLREAAANYEQRADAAEAKLESRP